MDGTNSLPFLIHYIAFLSEFSFQYFDAEDSWIISTKRKTFQKSELAQWCQCL